MSSEGRTGVGWQAWLSLYGFPFFLQEEEGSIAPIGRIALASLFPLPLLSLCLASCLCGQELGHEEGKERQGAIHLWLFVCGFLTRSPCTWPGLSVDRWSVDSGQWSVLAWYRRGSIEAQVPGARGGDCGLPVW